VCGSRRIAALRLRRLAAGLLNRVAPGIDVGFNRAWAPWFETQLLLLGVRESSHSSFGSPTYSVSVRGRLLAAILDGCAGKSAGPAVLRACLGVAFLSVDGFMPVVRPPRVWCCSGPERNGESTAVAEAPVAAFGLSSGLAVDFLVKESRAADINGEHGWIGAVAVAPRGERAVRRACDVRREVSGAAWREAFGSR
jgi:hypothetical protein